MMEEFEDDPGVPSDLLSCSQESLPAESFDDLTISDSHRPTVTTVNTTQRIPSRESSNSHVPTGVKGRVSSLEKLSASHTDDILAISLEIESVKTCQMDAEKAHHNELMRMRASIDDEIGSLRSDLDQLIASQRAENDRYSAQLCLLRTEKSAMQAQIVALQRRVFNLNEELGND